MARSAQQIAAKWRANLASSTQAIEDGVNGVVESPTAAAARSVNRMVEGVQRAAQEGRIQAGLLSVSKEDWQRAMREKGIPRIASGAAAAEGEMTSFMNEFLPHLDQLKSKLSSMPRGTLEQNIARANEAMRHNAKFRRRKR